MIGATAQRRRIGAAHCQVANMNDDAARLVAHQQAGRPAGDPARRADDSGVALMPTNLSAWMSCVSRWRRPWKGAEHCCRRRSSCQCCIPRSARSATADTTRWYLHTCARTLGVSTACQIAGLAAPVLRRSKRSGRAVERPAERCARRRPTYRARGRYGSDGYTTDERAGRGGGGRSIS